MIRTVPSLSWVSRYRRRVHTVDRRRGRAPRGLALATVCVAITMATATCSGGSSAHAPTSSTTGSDEVLRSLVAIAARGDTHESRVVYSVVRTAGGQDARSMEIEWYRPSPRLVATVEGGELNIERAGVETNCTPRPTPRTCTRIGPAEHGAASSADPYLVAVRSNRYSVSVGADRNIVGARARCFRLALRVGQPLIVGLGYSSETCFAADGVVVRTERDAPGGTETAVAIAVERSVRCAELRRVWRDYGTTDLADPCR